MKQSTSSPLLLTWMLSLVLDGGSRTVQVQNSTDPHLKTATYTEIIKKKFLQDMMGFFFCLLQLCHLTHLTVKWIFSFVIELVHILLPVETHRGCGCGHIFGQKYNVVSQIWPRVVRASFHLFFPCHRRMKGNVVIGKYMGPVGQSRYQFIVFQGEWQK